MRAGPRNRKIRIERFVTTQNAYNEDIETWLEHCSAFAEVKFGTGTERREAAQESATAPATFRVLHTPFTSVVTGKDRIVFDGSFWDISSAVPLGFNEGVEITAVRRADAEEEPAS